MSRTRRWLGRVVWMYQGQITLDQPGCLMWWDGWHGSLGKCSQCHALWKERLDGTSGNHLAQPPCSSKVTSSKLNKLSRTMLIESTTVCANIRAFWVSIIFCCFYLIFFFPHFSLLVKIIFSSFEWPRNTRRILRKEYALNIYIYIWKKKILK